MIVRVLTGVEQEGLLQTLRRKADFALLFSNRSTSKLSPRTEQPITGGDERGIERQHEGPESSLAPKERRRSIARKGPTRVSEHLSFRLETVVILSSAGRSTVARRYGIPATSRIDAG